MLNNDENIISPAIFLTGREITIHSRSCLSIHLKNGDPRIKKIIDLSLIGKNKIVTINPSFKTWQNSSRIYVGQEDDKGLPSVEKFNYLFGREHWYLITSLIYTGLSHHSNYTHISFSYKRDSSRILNVSEVENFRKYQLVGPLLIKETKLLNAQN